MNYLYPPAKSSLSFLIHKNVKRFLTSKLSLSILLLLFLLAGNPNDLRAENNGSNSCEEPEITCPEDNYGLDDGCNVEAPPAATTFNDEDDQNPDPALPTVEDGCGDLVLTHEDLHSESDCVHVLKRIYTITDEEDDYASCTQIFTWRVDDEGPTFVNPPGDLTLECDVTVPDPPDLTATDNCVPPDILFINEIHYDNIGTDVNEFIEIAGQAGIDLSDYELYAYEQHDGMYDDAKTLTGIIPDEGDGWGAVYFDRDYLGGKFFENGVSGLALIKNGDWVVEFISYEGVVVATNGPAEGCTSKLIGVEEGATPEDESLQRIGTACEACDFSWIEPDEDDPGFALATPGYINEGQTFDDDQCPDLPIEITYMQEITPGDCPQEQTITRTWTATDVCENSTEHVQTITIEDTTPPVPPAPPADITVQCATDVPPPLDLTAPDNCGADAPGIPSADITPGNCVNQFVMVRTYTFTDECGNSASISHTITVHDDTPPVITCPADFTVECIEDVPACNPNDATASDNCVDVTITCEQGPLVGGPCGGTVTNTYTATDACGNTSTCTQVITVDDTTDPTFTVPEDVTIDCSDDPNDLTLTGEPTDVMDNCMNGGANPSEIWVNEFHYDNASSDVGEFIEIAGTAGLDLSNYELVLYNGNGGAVYNTVTLSGTIDDESNGFGAVSFAIAGIQNGAPDGFALVDGGSNVIQFLSYEGTFVANGGPANGMSSTDVGVSETGSTPVGQSLQLSGTGSEYDDFVWNNPSAESPGDLNANQTMVSPPPPPPGPTVEYFDSFTPICNGLLNNITRTWRVTDACGNVNEQIQMITVEDNDAPTFTVPADVTIECDQDPDDLTVTGNVTDEMDNCDPDPTVVYTDEEDLTDCGDYTGTISRTWTATDACGNATSQTQTITVEDTTPPTFTTPADVTIECIDDPDDLTITGDVTDAMDNCTGAGQMSVWVNEFHYDNAGGDVGEFIEVAGTAGVDLSDYQLVLYNGANGLVYNTINLSGVLTDESNGFGFVSFTTSGLQNGAPDGFALVLNGTNVIEFLSYEGSFTANNGPASGMMSTNVGVSENGGTPIGFSLQLIGTGSESGDFAWSGPANDSPGSINSGQTMNTVPPPTTMITIEYEDESDVTTCDGGTILRTWTVTDACDNATSQVQTITVNPPADPIITCPADMTVECFADIDANFDDATVVTDCDLGFTGYVSQPDVEGAQNCPGTTYTYTYKAIDDCGNTSTCEQIFTIENDPPEITVIPGETVSCFEDIVVSNSDATVTTSCGDDFELKILPPIVEGTFDCPGTTYTYTFRVRDNCGREVTADRVFTVGNNNAPTIIAPPDMTISCAFNINVNPDYAEVTTGCSLGFETTVSDPVISGTDDCPGTTYTYIYTVTDDCGRTASNSRVFTIQNGPPIIACPENCIIQNCEDGDYLAIIDAWIANITATSSCDENIVVNNNYNPNNLGFCIWNGYTPVTFTATDNCGRTTVCVAIIVITDTEAPEIIEPAQDMLTLCNFNTQDVLDEWVDNNGGAVVVDGCWDDDLTWSTNPANPTINCMGMMGNTSIEVTFTATDGCGNSVSTTATFTALMFGNDIIIHGGLQTEEGNGVESAQVLLEGNSPGMPSTQMSDDEGKYEFSNLTFESNYVVTPAKNDDPLNGLTTFDIVLMTKHVLASELLDSPYKIIAADINNSGTVSTIDILKLRRLILFIDTEFQENTSWRFVDAEFVFPDPTNPFATSFPEVYSINGLLESEEANFVAIKIGDLNGSATPSSLMSGENRNTVGELNFELEDVQLEEGEQYEIPFRSSDFNGMLGYQFTFNFNTEVFDFIETEAGSLTKLDAGNFGLSMIEEGVITTSWSNNIATNIENDEILFTLRFIAKTDAKLSETLRISSQYTKSEAYNNEGLLDIGLNFNVDGKEQIAEFALFQNQPNPFKNETVIGFNLPKSGTAKMKFFDVTGKLLKEVEGEFSEGYNEISVTRADLPTAGVLYYQLETANNSATKKMILLTLN